MTSNYFRTAVLLLAVLIWPYVINAQDFSFTGKDGVTIVYSKEGPKLDSIAAHLLSEDIGRVTGNQPKVITELANATKHVIVIGNIASGLVQKLISKQSSLYKNLQGKWECFALKVIDKPTTAIAKVFVIAGSDVRGTAYGVFTLSQKLGVSPWYWWADVPVKQQTALTIRQPEFISAPPSVKYRGIFINDEDWGLQPWAAKTFEPETGDIGPKTYAKVFELLLRLKANLIWPAMHPGTKAFYHYPLNKKVAEEYSMVIGSSHAEPMLRNNVGEWDEKTMGHFNYITNKEKVFQYWESRVSETSGNEVMYTLGMRGVHDSGIEGVKDAKEAVPLVERIISDQRGLLSKYRKSDVTAIPQVFTAYKEVLDIYDKGLKVPEDVTLVWPDDNYGYIQRLNNEAEQKRSGGSGVYYHASYWGRPHDYLWLSSTHPSLIREEMMKAYENGCNRLWVLNVGDIKPLEYIIQLFMDMACNAHAFKESNAVRKHLQEWTGKIFGKQQANTITNILWEYYRLAFERRPEFMGWSQTEPTTKTTYTSYNHFSYGDEAQQRINRYDSLEHTVKALRNEFNTQEKDAFYQLVYYPVVCASWMNKKFLYRDKAYSYSKQNRISAYYYSMQSIAAYDSIIKETAFFNAQLTGGKWKDMMSMKPRDLPVFKTPELPACSIQKSERWTAVPEGYDTLAYKNKLEKKLPTFIAGVPQSYFVEVFLSDSVAVEWKAKPSAEWIKLSSDTGRLFPDQDNSSQRLWVSIDWTKAPAATTLNGSIEFSANENKTTIQINALRPAANDFAKFSGFVEENGVISIYASHYQNKVEKPGMKWQPVQGLGHTNASLQSVFTPGMPIKNVDTNAIQQQSASVTYTFYSLSNEVPKLAVYTLPTHPLNKKYSMRYAVRIDNSPVKMIDFKTIGRSEEWKQNVLRNAAIKEINLPTLQPGRHTLTIYSIDPGVVLDRMVIRFGDASKNYGVIKETWKN